MWVELMAVPVLCGEFLRGVGIAVFALMRTGVILPDVLAHHAATGLPLFRGLYMRGYTIIQFIIVIRGCEHPLHKHLHHFFFRYFLYELITVCLRLIR